MFNYYFFKTFLSLFAIYLTAGLGNIITMKTSDINLGSEGQIYIAGFIAAIFLNTFKTLPPPLALPLCFLVSGVASSLVCLLSAYLKTSKGITFLLSSFIISCAIIPLLNELVSGKFRTTESPLLATAFILQKFRYSYIINIFISVILAILVYLFFKKSRIGVEIGLYGKAREFTVFMGIDEPKILYTSAILTGFLHGFSGAMVVCSMHYTCYNNFASSMGWNALSAAIIARFSPLKLIISSLAMSFLISSSEQIALFNNFNFDITTLVQAIVIFVIAFPFCKEIIFEHKKQKLENKGDSDDK